MDVAFARCTEGERRPWAAPALVGNLDLVGCHLFHAIRADLLRLPGRTTDAPPAEDAIARAENAAERTFLQSSLLALAQG